MDRLEGGGKSEFTEVPKLHEQEPRELYKLISITGFIRDCDENIMDKIGNDVCMIIYAFYDRDKLSECMRKYPRMNWMELIYLTGCDYFELNAFDEAKGHFIFDVIEQNDDGFIKILSINDDINKWFNQKLQFEMIRDLYSNPSGQKMLLSMKALNGNRYKILVDENVTGIELQYIVAILEGIPGNQLRIVHCGRLVGGVLKTLRYFDIKKSFDVYIILRG